MVRYLFRLDDACPTMNCNNWSRILKILDNYNIKPIIAVIPNNEDVSNNVDSCNMDFWNEIKKWRNKGYIIALHGYNHVYESKNSGLLGVNRFSEFAGVALDSQKEKINKACNILKNHNIISYIWVAPGHSFDKNTLKALRLCSDIKIISDGFSIFPFNYNGFFWLPVQLWSPIQKTKGIWTICYHPNTMKESDFTILETFLKNNYLNCNMSINEIFEAFIDRKISFSDLIFWTKTYVIKIIKLVLLNRNTND